MQLGCNYLISMENTPMSPVDRFIPSPFVILHKKQESREVFTLEIQKKEKEHFAFLPGQFNMLYLPGVGESAISISSDPSEPTRIAHTIRSVGSVTQNLKKLKVGEIVYARGPFGIGWPTKACEGKSILLIAGGIGIAPLRSLIYFLLDNLEKYSAITLIYGMRTPFDKIFKKEYANWKKKIKIILTVDHGDQNWKGNIGSVSQCIPQAIRETYDPKNTITLVCGPEIMMHFCYYALQDAGVPSENLYFSMERNMQCGLGICGHCQWGPYFICKDGPVMNVKQIESCFFKHEL